MKTKKIIILILAIFVVCLIVLSSCSAANEAKRRQRFEERFALELPTDAKLAYYHGATTRDGTDEYYVWQFESEPVYILNSEKYKIKVNSTETGEEAEQIKQYFKEGAEENIAMHSNKVPQNCRPIWENEYFVACWSKRSSFGLDSDIRLGPSYFYDIDQKLLIAWYIAT